MDSRYLDTFNGVLELENDRATVHRLTLRSSTTPRSQDVKSRGRSRDGKDGKKKPPAPVKTMSSGSLLKEYRVEKQRPVTPTVPDESEVNK